MEGDMEAPNPDMDMAVADDDSVKELDEMKRRLKEMEDEAAALREMQAKVEKEMGAQDPATIAANQAWKEEVDARSVFVGNEHGGKVEANDAVTVASMTRPRPLPNEILSDLAVSTATKLQSYRHLGKYFKQSAKAFEQKINREARFYGALIRFHL